MIHIKAGFDSLVDNIDECLNCGNTMEKDDTEIHHHHVFPASMGGTYTIPLCTICHSKLHGSINTLNTGILSGLARRRYAQERGEPAQVAIFDHYRDSIESMLLEGYTHKDIVAHLVDISGHIYLNTPNLSRWIRQNDLNTPRFDYDQFIPLALPWVEKGKTPLIIQALLEEKNILLDISNVKYLYKKCKNILKQQDIS